MTTIFMSSYHTVVTIASILSYYYFYTMSIVKYSRSQDQLIPNGFASPFHLITKDGYFTEARALFSILCDSYCTQMKLFSFGLLIFLCVESVIVAGTFVEAQLSVYHPNLAGSSSYQLPLIRAHVE